MQWFWDIALHRKAPKITPKNDPQWHQKKTPKRLQKQHQKWFKKSHFSEQKSALESTLKWPHKFDIKKWSKKWSKKSSKNDQKQTQNIKNKDVEEIQKNEIKNLPSTVVMKHKTSVTNSFLVLIVLVSFIATFFLLRSYGVNFFVLINFYIHEFYFNLKLIIADIAKIIHQVIN